MLVAFERTVVGEWRKSTKEMIKQVFTTKKQNIPKEAKGNFVTKNYNT